MFEYIIKRIFLLFVTLFGITVITFVVTRLTPGDPATMSIQPGGGGTSNVAYQDLVERNRRNLGLDRPMVLNLRFDSRTTQAHRAIDDLYRTASFWQDEARRRLVRVNTIALEPVLERYEMIGTPGERLPTGSAGEAVETVSEDARRRMLAELLPRLAPGAPSPPAGASRDEIHAHYRQWFEENRERYTDEAGRHAVEQWLATAPGTDMEEELYQEVRQIGAYSVPHLVRNLNAIDPVTRARVNRALQGQTGFRFAADDLEFATNSDEIMARWRSWWRREMISYQDPGIARHGWNIISNTQFGMWAGQAFRLDFGDSYTYRRPVMSLIRDALPISLVISLLSVLLSYIIAIPLGILSAINKNSTGDKIVTLMLFILYSLPSFWVAGLLLLTMTGPPFLNLFPARGINSEGIHLGADGVAFSQWFFDRLWHLVLPVLCLTYGSLAFLSRQVRSAMLEVISQDYIRTAKAKGVSWRSVVFRHAFRNSLIPLITISASILPELIAGAIIIESIFTIPGMGVLTLDAIVQRDYPVVNALLFLSAFLTLLGILIADLLYAVVDPRISYEGQ
ncbi:MAG: ABC transporter permease subunit [Candidatus Sumerlaeia bacterium]|nr:ABC transporter permease subunit [Candidatus Sumerlaeia bacterium]